jgi:hypothetical protein
MAARLHNEVSKFLNGRRRVIALADYAAEKTFISIVPHRFLLGFQEESALQSELSTPKLVAG